MRPFSKRNRHDPEDGEMIQNPANRNGGAGENQTVWLVRYDEIFLKSDRVRRIWEQTLISGIRDAMPGCRVQSERGRIWLRGSVDPDKLRKIFGIVSFSECQACKLQDLEPALLGYCSRIGIGAARTFALRVRRVGKHPFSSHDVAERLGDLIRAGYAGLQVDLTHPGKELHVEIRGERVYLYDQVIPGAGGIPPGVEGTVVALISGGIDSPVAAWMMMKRGCRVIPVFVDMPPFLGDSALDRVEKVIGILREYQPDIEIRVITDTYVARARDEVRKTGDERYVCLLCKRRMYRIAEEIAGQAGAKGVVTGESMGQVASQTLDNLFALDAITTLPFYRPLIGLDKSEITLIARKIGTFPASIMPVSSCCCAVPKKPATRADPGLIDRLESRIDSY
jgi:thiamine biosynthesis protein ThiI